jgi:hypothetical protein
MTFSLEDRINSEVNRLNRVLDEQLEDQGVEFPEQLEGYEQELFNAATKELRQLMDIKIDLGRLESKFNDWDSGCEV